MMTGRVSALHILVSVPFRRVGEPDIAIEFVVDTGFTGELCLPPDAVAALGLPFRYDLQAHLADDSSVVLPVHDATILWHGVEFEAIVLATGKRPLLGTALLDGYELHSQFRENGLAAINEM
jgi:clan AA aspartic protease